jgi:hypothetical protein
MVRLISLRFVLHEHIFLHLGDAVSSGKFVINFNASGLTDHRRSVSNQLINILP